MFNIQYDFTFKIHLYSTKNYNYDNPNCPLNYDFFPKNKNVKND